MYGLICAKSAANELNLSQTILSREVQQTREVQQMGFLCAQVGAELNLPQAILLREVQQSRGSQRMRAERGSDNIDDLVSCDPT